jgi:acetate---CoA ligase (ADP-forming)
VRAKVRAWQDADYPRGWVPFDEICELLAIAGVWIAGHRVVADPDAAASAAEVLRFPVVLKANVRGLVHKSDQGAVQLGLASAAAVREAAVAMRERLAAKGFTVESFVVQQQIDRGVEALVGMTTDPSLGPLLVAGIGGVAVELYKDVAFRVTPVTDVDANEMLDQLRGKALFDGYRGAPPADRDALRDVILRIAALVEVMPELLELDLNPVIMLPPGQGAVAVDARLRIAARSMQPDKA